MDGGSAVAVLVVVPQLVAQHLGALHPFEKVLTLVLAFGPFVLLAVVVLVRRRQDAAEDEHHASAERTAARDPARDRAPDVARDRAPDLAQDPAADPER